ncbi:sugar ABC transporter substrate-binding protein [Salinibacterium sp. UTAS2018]|uniref:ABC transporter substrate-binding protein n=1 Tax=unclassified Salinibacterium TaxID=2632331 RepID=UPI001009531E|nr:MULTISPECIES: sugar ABC transporter substrate-binding protein [unclassified Salinibacterium]MBH0009099.1 sugar ABC transporter substrate-binding protein [Salinibacterium sp. SWN1162]QAV69666.1 sugar ABC transporter substrate-binding protein [Salinibacterium sp. UTAS2018]
MFRLNAATKLVAGAAAAALLLTGCSAEGSAPDALTEPITQAQIDEAMNTPTTLTMWSWVPEIQAEIDLFEEAYPNIKVELSNVGQGLSHYTKLRTAVKSGEVPDVVQMEYQYISSFQNDLLDLAPYGADAIADDYVSSVWGQVSSEGAVYGIPQDFGPMGNLYRTDIYAEAGVTPPATWDEYAVAARTIKDKTGSYITNFPGNNPGQLVGLLWQAGAKPFSYDGDETVGVDLNSAEAKEVMAYWQELIDEDLVSVEPDFTDNWFQSLAKGKYASWLGAAWGPTFLEGAIANTSGNWGVSELPQYDTENPASGFWGGASDAVMAESKNPIAAYKLAEFINHDEESSRLLALEQSLFPPLISTLESADFSDQAPEFYSGQQVNKLFAEIAPTVDPDFQWLPYMDFVYSSFNETLGSAIADRGDLTAGLDAWQDAVVTFGTDQGFTVK